MTRLSEPAAAPSRSCSRCAASCWKIACYYQRFVEQRARQGHSMRELSRRPVRHRPHHSARSGNAPGRGQAYRAALNKILLELLARPSEPIDRGPVAHTLYHWDDFALGRPKEASLLRGARGKHYGATHPPGTHPIIRGPRPACRGPLRLARGACTAATAPGPKRTRLRSGGGHPAELAKGPSRNARPGRHALRTVSYNNLASSP